MSVRLTAADKQQIARSYEAHIPVRDIASAAGIPERRVYVVLDELQVPRRRSLHSKQIRQRVAELYATGWPYEEIAQVAGVTAGQVAYYVHDQRLASRKPPVSADERQMIITLHLQGRSCADIMRQTGRSRKTVSGVLKSVGLQIRAPRSISLTDLQHASQRMATGQPINVEASALGVRPASLRRALQREGLPVPAPANPVYELRRTAFSESSPQRDYYIGLLIADGTRASGNTVAIALQERDTSILEHLRDFVGDVRRPLYPLPAGDVGGPKTHLAWSCPEHAADIERHGIVRRKSKEGTRASNEMATSAAFWFGAVDGDGSIGFNADGTPYVFLTGWRDVCEQFSDWASSITGAYRRKCSLKTNNTWQVGYSGAPAREICEMFLNSGVQHSIPRKREAAQRALEWVSQQERNAERRVNQTCMHCGVEFERPPSKAAAEPFCSKAHRSEFWVARSNPDAPARRMRDAAANAQSRWAGGADRSHIAQYKDRLPYLLRAAGVAEPRVRLDLNQQATVFEGIVEGRNVLVGCTVNWKAETPRRMRSAAEREGRGIAMLHVSPARPDSHYLAVLGGKASTSRVPRRVLGTLDCG